MRRLQCNAFHAVTVTVLAVLAHAPLSGQDPVQELIRTRLEAEGAAPVLVAGGEAIHAAAALPRFYEARGYAPAWSRDGVATDGVAVLLREIGRSREEGLRPADYHLDRIRALDRSVRSTGNPRALADLDLLVTDAFMVLGSHYLAGRVNPATIDAEWYANRREADFARRLQQALDDDDVGTALRSLLPPQPGYARLRQALARYRAVAAAGGWPRVAEGPTLHPGEAGDRVAALRARLAATGDLETGPPGDSFDAATETAVRRFQRRHGLEEDGAVGPATLAALNVPAADRVRQIVLNMERWRWLPQDLGAFHVLVNIADFSLDLVDAGVTVLSMRVAVGRPYRRTPVFSDRMTHLVLSPYWYVPENIAVQDKLPDIRRQGVDWFSRNSMRVFQGWGADAVEVDPASVDWSAVPARPFPYRLRQEPGPANALGRVKFMFPNRFNVYLHDTPGREIFARSERAFSSGCIRIEKPMELAEYLLRDQGWTRQGIQAVVDRRVEQMVMLRRQPLVHLLYWTAFAAEDGAIHFRRDIYDRDGRLATALEEAPPVAGGAI